MTYIFLFFYYLTKYTYYLPLGLKGIDKNIYIMKISLCIPTMNRYDTFLQYNLPKYLENEYIDEIVICDETGEDYDKIIKNMENTKIRIYKNDICLGAFKNKIKVTQLAKNEIVCLMDSDNFCDESYFKAFYDYINEHGYNEKVIYCPEKALPRFDYSEFINKIYDYNSITSLPIKLEMVLNTGNYIFNKNMLNMIDSYLTEDNYISNCYSYDVIYMNYLLLKYGSFQLVVVPNMTYSHVVHNGSYFMETSNYAKEFFDDLKNKLLNK